jgi:hypothetical protein
MERPRPFSSLATTAVLGTLCLAATPGAGQAPARLLDSARVVPGAGRTTVRAAADETLRVVTTRYVPSRPTTAALARSGWSMARPVVFGESTEDETFSELQQSATVLSGGGFGVVWTLGSFPAYDVLMQWLDANGQPVFPTGGLVVAGGPPEQREVVIAARPSGGAYVAYSEESTIRVSRTTATAGLVGRPGASSSSRSALPK